MPINKNAFLRYRIIDSCLTNSNNRYPTLDDIKEKIEEHTGSISLDSIRKDIQMLKRIYNAPIYFDRLEKGYKYTEAGFSIKEFPLTEDEINVLDFSTAFLGKLKGTAMYESFESAIDKVIKGYRISKIIENSERAILQPEASVGSSGNKWIEFLLNAIIQRQCLLINYKPYQREPNTHNVSPYLIKEYRKRWYLFGFSSEKSRVITLGLDRVDDIKKSGLSYYHDNTFHEDDYFKYCIGIMKDGKPEKVVLEFDDFQRRYVLSQVLHKSQKMLEDSNGKLVIELEVYITHELIQMVLSYGEQVKVIAPQHLKDKIKDVLLKSIASYTTN